jgi:hypothetical protein
MPARLALLLLGFVAAAASAETWHAERVTSGGGAPPRVERLWSKGAWLRAEVVIAGHPVLTFVKGDRYIVVDALAGKGTSIQRSPKAVAEDATRGRPFGTERAVLVKLGGERVKTEGEGGATCELYRLTDEAGRREVCVSTGEDGVPLFTRAWSRQTGAETETRYIAWSKDLEGKGVTIGDDFFAPDPRIPLESFTYEGFMAKAQQGEAPAVAPILYPELLVAR